MEDFYSISDFAIKLHVHPNTIRRLIKKGRISAVKLCSGKRCLYRIPHSEISRIAQFDMEEMIEKILDTRKMN